MLVKRAGSEDFRFIKLSLVEDIDPDFHVLNTSKAIKAGQIVKPKTKISFRDLLDQTFSMTSKMLTAIVVAEVTNAAGQKVFLFTADQQLYNTVFDVIWVDR